MKNFALITALSVVAIFISFVHASAFLLPDTGQTKCYQSVYPYAEISCDGSGQDGAYSMNPLSYTDNGDGTVTDNNTGLMWQRQDDANYRLWDSAVEYCNNLTLGSYSDWRLPSKKEFITIFDYSLPYPGPMINSIFTNTKLSAYWSSTSDAQFSNRAWKLFFNRGSILQDYKSSFSFVRCVRGAETPGPDLTDNGNGTVSDSRTGLMWQQDDPGSMNWISALNYCQNLQLAETNDWRLPNVKELESITDDGRHNPSIDTYYFPGAQTYDYWSSTVFVSDPYYVWFVGLEPIWGSVNTSDRKFPYYVRCVRQGNIEPPQNPKFLTINIAGNGIVVSSPEGLVCDEDVCTGSFTQGTSVTLAADADDGYAFVYWDDGKANYIQNPLTVEMDEDKTLNISFQLGITPKHGPGWVITIDGMDMWSTFWQMPAPTTYLYDEIFKADYNRKSTWADKILEEKGPIIPFIWTRNTTDTRDATYQLYELIKYLNSTSRPITILAHSWGSVLAYIALRAHDDIFVEKLLTLGSPLDSYTPGVFEATNWWLMLAGINSVNKPGNLGTWHNYWTACDPIAAKISSLPKKDNYVNKTLYLSLFACHSSYFKDHKKWDTILKDVISK